MPPKLTFNPQEFKGSRLRCLQLTSLQDAHVARFLNELVEPFANVTEDDIWMPRGMLFPEEVDLAKSAVFLAEQRRQTALGWWLSVTSSRSRTPIWDIVSTGQMAGRRGLVLVEAKAHPAELNPRDACKAGRENRPQIKAAIAEANDALNAVLPGWVLDAHSHYQLSNRFAWAWKVASMGTPVVLVYLGFLNATEMLTDTRQIFSTARDWETRVREYSKDVVPEAMWNGTLKIKGVPMTALIRSAEVSVQARVAPQVLRR